MNIRNSNASAKTSIARAVAPLLVASDELEVREFYHGLVDVTAIDSETGGGEDGAVKLPSIIAVDELAGADPGWIVEFEVADLAATIERAIALHTVVDLTRPLGTGRYLLTAPDGSRLCLSEASRGGSVIGTPLLELCAIDIDDSLAFYKQLLGLSSIAVPGDPHQYTVLAYQGQPVAGVVNMRSLLSTTTPARWVPYFHVKQLEWAVAVAVDFGALVKVPPTTSTFSVRYAILTDLTGASFGLRQRPADGLFGTFDVVTGLFRPEIVAPVGER